MRVESMQAFRDLRLGVFLDRLVRHLERKYPEKTAGVPPEALRARVERLCDRSRHFGLTSEAHVTAFTELSLEWGDGFEDEPERRDVRGVLRDRSLGPEEKLRRVRAILNRFEGEDPFAEDDPAFADPGPPPFVLAD